MPENSRVIPCALALAAALMSTVLGQQSEFTTPTDLAAGRQPYSVAAADFNGDGLVDLAVVDYGSSGVSVLLGQGNGAFQASASYLVGAFPSSVAVGDLNGDGF